jgi:hypothetical protein
VGRSDADNAERHNAELSAPACRTCGCTELDSRCIEATGAPCWWVEPDLCSRCSPDQKTAAQALAKSIAADLCETAVLPGVMVIILDRNGHLQCGLATVDHPIANPLLVLAGGVHDAVERITGAIGDRAPAPAPQPPERAACIHCMQDVARVDDVGAIRTHSMTCTSSPVVKELQRLRLITDQAEVVARHWETQDGINGAEIDKLRDLVYGR